MVRRGRETKQEINQQVVTDNPENTWFVKTMALQKVELPSDTCLEFRGV